ncbi:MAG: tRNA uridine-5-carboxymethylaminomethyl(34) synthesis GTPase MnmE [Spirochaetota bacterium]
MVQNTPFDTIAAISTPPGEGGIGIVRISGERAFDITKKIFVPRRKKKQNLWGGSFIMHLGYIKENNRTVDEVLVSIMKAPRTYTREDMVEINCHGGPVAVREVLRVVISRGARMAEPGEFTRRAFINGRIDLSQAEAVLDIVRARTGRALETAVNQLKGQLGQKIIQLVQLLRETLVVLEANIDFPEEEDVEAVEKNRIREKILQVHSQLEELIASYGRGKMVKEGVLTVLSGKPNVGKSSILNAFVRFERAIVTSIPGTTRDVIEEQLNLNGIPFILADTAGITESTDLIEKEGVSRSRSYMQRAQLVLLVFDANAPLDQMDLDIARRAAHKRHITVINKIDLPRKLDLDLLFSKTKIDPNPVYLSATHGTGLDELQKKMSEAVISGEAGGDYSVMITSLRHYNILKKAQSELDYALKSLDQKMGPELTAFDVRNAMDLLGEITGKVTSKDILKDIFNNFCIGK